MKYTKSEHLIYWLIPALAGYSLVPVYFYDLEFYKFWVFSPFGFVETFIFGTLLSAIIFGIYLIFTKEIKPYKSARILLVIYVLGAFYFLGEDINWGQYYRETFFGYDVNNYFIDNNKEMETNLHNMSSWFNQKPRMIVMLWVLVVGVLYPLGWKFPKEKTKKIVPDFFWPDRRILPLGIMVIAARLPERIAELVGHNTKYIRFSEAQEILLSIFILLFLFQIYDKLKQKTLLN